MFCIQILANNQSYPAWCQNTPGLNLISVILPLITMLIMTAQICSHFCPTNSKDIKLLQSSESTLGACTGQNEVMALSSMLGTTPWGCCACAQVSLRCSFGFWTSLRTLLQHLQQQHHPCFRERDGRSKLTDLEEFKQTQLLICSSKSELLHTRHGWWVLWDFSAAESSYLKK